MSGPLRYVATLATTGDLCLTTSVWVHTQRNKTRWMRRPRGLSPNLNSLSLRMVTLNTPGVSGGRVLIKAVSM
jgi:hypothetical protein